MTIEEVVVLLPCHSLEDFPVHHEGEEAEGLLAAWSAIWHPALIAACDKIPLWFRADAPPENPRPRLIVVPQVCESQLLPGWPTRAKSEGATLIRKLHKRAEITAACLQALDTSPAAPERPPLPDDLVSDFLALGTGYLLVELLTRQMRYMSNLDETRFQEEAREAARAAVEGRHEDARQNLKNAFESLYEARERFYPVDNFLIDLTLTAETTIGPSLRRELAGDTPINVLLSGRLLDRLAEAEPESLAALRHALDRRTACVVGGDYDERETPLLPPETVLEELRRGLATIKHRLEARPTCYARRRQGLTPLLPQLLARHGYEGALGFTLDDGTFPNADQAKFRWEGLSIDAVDCLGRVPLDANKAESFLELPRTIGEAMDRDYVATTVFAHWPGAVTDCYADLRRMAAYAPIVGKFITLADYFDHTERPGQISKFSADRYRTTFLRQAIVRNLQNPVTWSADGLHRRLRADAAAALTTMIDVVRLRAEPVDINDLIADVDESITPTATTERLAEIDDRLTQNLQGASLGFAAALAGRGQSAAGLLVVNPQLGSRRELVDVSTLAQLPEVGGPVAAVQQSGERKLAVVEVPSMGFTWLTAGAAQSTTPEKAGGLFRARKAPPSIVEELRLRNEFLEVHVSPKTGGIQGLFGRNLRDRRLSQQLAFRLPQPRPKVGEAWRDPDLEPIYTQMICDRVETTLDGAAVGEITTVGRLVDADDRRVAGFTQRVRVVAGSRVAEVEIELDAEETPRAEAWASYYACRFAWADETTSLGRGVFLMHQPTTAKRPESPYYIELKTETTNTLILPDGLPHHLLTGERMLDTILIGKGETRRRFRFGLAIEAAHPAATALNFMQPPIVVPGASQPASASSSWLFHVDAKNVVATHWESLREGEVVVGFRVRLMETEGLAGRVVLKTIRPIREAHHVDGLGEPIHVLAPEGDGVGLDFGPYEWLEVEARF